MKGVNSDFAALKKKVEETKQTVNDATNALVLAKRDWLTAEAALLKARIEEAAHGNPLYVWDRIAGKHAPIAILHCSGPRDCPILIHDLHENTVANIFVGDLFICHKGKYIPLDCK